MKITIYQIDIAKDTDNVAFRSFSELHKIQGDSNIRSERYTKVYEGETIGNTLEDAYYTFNVDHPKDYKARSLSVSDVIQIEGSSVEKDGFYYCDTIGFKEIKDFEPEKTSTENLLRAEKARVKDKVKCHSIRDEYPKGTKIRLISMDGESQMPCGLKGEVEYVDDIGQIHVLWENGSSLALNPEVDSFEKDTSPDMMQVLLVQPMKSPKMIEIEAKSLESMQKVVDGDIEAIYPFADDPEIALICNEEGKLNDMEPNRAIYDEDHNMVEIIAGDFFICSAPENSENFEGLNKSSAEKYAHKFKSPEIFISVNGDIKAIPCRPESNIKTSNHEQYTR